MWGCEWSHEGGKIRGIQQREREIEQEGFAVGIPKKDHEVGGLIAFRNSGSDGQVGLRREIPEDFPASVMVKAAIIRGGTANDHRAVGTELKYI